MIYADKWQEYELLDCSDGEKLERWGKYVLVRPDPQAIWKNEKHHPRWKNPDASYRRSRKGGGAWNENRLPEEWTMEYPSLELKFKIKPTGFKHTGLFPEQAANWEWFSEIIKNAGRPVKVLNLFAYTGGATVAASKAGASVVHVDASKGMVAWAKENAALSGVADRPIRYIVDDCKKFVEREIRRGNLYDGIIMDPPSYGRGPNGEIWKLEDSVDELVKLTAQLLSPNALFFLLNSYTTGLSAGTMGYILHNAIVKTHGGKVTSEELGLPVTQSGSALPCGAASRWAGSTRGQDRA